MRFSYLALLTVLFLASGQAQADSTLVFNEIQYHPQTQEAQMEWVELHNQMAVDLDISNWRIDGGIEFTFPQGTIVPGKGYIVVAINPTALSQATGFSNAMGPFLGRLDNGGETLRIFNNSNRRMDRVRYRDSGGWPVAPDGSGVTLSKIHPDAGSGNNENWSFSKEVNGTPGRINFTVPGGPPPAPEGIVSYWNFEGSGSTVIDTYAGNSGPKGSTTDRVDGLVGDKALEFDNTHNAQVNVGSGVSDSFEFTTGITIEALIISDWTGDADDNDSIFRKEDGSHRIVLSLQNDGNDDGRSDPDLGAYSGPVLSFGLNIENIYSELDMPLDGQDGRPSFAELTDGSAHHIAATYHSASGLKAIFFDGVMVYSKTFPGGSEIESGGSTSAYIGNMAGRLQGFKGVIDEVAIWNRALSSDEISRHHSLTQNNQDYFTQSIVNTESIHLRFTEAYGVPGNDAWIELQNQGEAAISVAGLVLHSSNNQGASHTLNGPPLQPGDYIVIHQDDFPAGIVANEKIFLFDASETQLIDAVYLRDDHRGKTEGLEGRWQFPNQPTPGADNTFSFQTDVIINEIHYHPFPIAATPPTYEEDILIEMEGNWEFTSPNDGIEGTSWRTGNNAGESWITRPALFYNEGSSLPANKATEIDLGNVTFYFRTTFEIDALPSNAELSLRHIIDDGAVFYLNGQPVESFNLPLTGVTPSTFASPGVGNATSSELIALPTEHLQVGTNWFAVEVHQGSANSSDVVFGAELSSRILTDPGRPFGESPSGWIELFNRGNETVDLTGWKFDDGINFDFPDGTTIDAGEYLVIAEDKEFLQLKYPGLNILSTFGGNLSNSSDELELEDANGNLADRVEYYDGGRWASYADGGGSSLELLDPDADNSKPEAWAPSDETQQSTWKTYSYRQRAVNRPAPSQWREFIIGLLDAGEILVDDLSVVENPDGAAVQFLQNGDFETGADKWRLLGNHRHSRVIDDPDDAGNKVLHLVATGPTEHMHNHLETTLANGEAVNIGTEYEIRFRARWLAGSNQFHTRLYFHKVAKTIRIDGPESEGTPGAENSVLTGNLGPTYDNMIHSPAVPRSGESIAIEAQIEDPDGVAAARIRYNTGGAWSSRSMSLDADGFYRGTIPGQSGGTLVHFYIEAEDDLGETTHFPKEGPESRALIRVEDNRARSNALHHIRILMTPSDTTYLHTDTNVMSNERLRGTVIYRESEIFYNVGVRLKGSERGRPGGHRVSFSVQFDQMQLFRGVHRTVSMDRSGGWGLGRGPTGQDEMIVKHIGNIAGGIPGMYDDLSYVIAPRSAQDGECLLMMGKYTKVFLDSQFKNGSDGDMFKIELIYYPTTTNNGSPEGLKRPQPDGVIGTDLRNLGDDKEAYRWNFLKENNLDRDNYQNLIELGKFLGGSTSTVIRDAEDWIDTEQVVRMYVLHSLTGINDTYWYAGNHHNALIYQRPEDGKFLWFYWDNDFAFSRGTNSSLWGSITLAKIFQSPKYQRMFHGHMADLVEKTFVTGNISRWTQHYGLLAREESAFQAGLNWMLSRRSFVNGQKPANVPIEITTNNGQDFEVSTPIVTLEGRAPVDVKELVFAGYPLPDFDWDSTTSWETTIELSPGENDLLLLANDFNGSLLDTDQIKVTTTFNFPAPTISVLTPDQGEPETLVEIVGTGFLLGAEVLLDGEVVEGAERISSSRMQFSIPFGDAGEKLIQIQNTDGKISNSEPLTLLPTLERFVRGDVNLNGVVEIGDAITSLLYQFRGQTITCLDAADVDNDEDIETDDAIKILVHLFLGGPAPETPYPDVGIDAGVDTMGCVEGLRQ